MGLYQIKNCEDCGKKFTGHIAKKRCDACILKRKQKKVYSLICAYEKCKKPFETMRTDQKFCHDNCRKQYHSDIYYRRKSNGELS